jgi:hypothetical protein
MDCKTTVLDWKDRLTVVIAGYFKKAVDKEKDILTDTCTVERISR